MKCTHQHNQRQGTIRALAGALGGATSKEGLPGVWILSRVSLVLIRSYQLTRFLRRPSCRFYPSCSQYTAVSIERFGLVRGLILGSWRILHCHPWHPGGVDEVPEMFPVQFVGRLSDRILELSGKLAAAAVLTKSTKAIPAGWGHQARGKG